MAIENMKLINVIGMYKDFDRIVAQNVLCNDIHLESAFDVFHNLQGLYPFIEDNPYTEVLTAMTEIAAQVGVLVNDEIRPCKDVDIARLSRYSQGLTTSLSNIAARRAELQAEYEENEQVIAQLIPLHNVSIPLDQLFNFKYIKVRFGRLPKDSFLKLQSYLGDYNAFYFKLNETKDTVFDVYFAPLSTYEKVDSIFTSLYFERVRISDKAAGLPAVELERLQKENAVIKTQIERLDLEKQQILKKEKDDIVKAYHEIKYIAAVHDARRFAAHTHDSFYLVGWVPEAAIPELTLSFEKEQNVTFLVEEPGAVHNLQPPTKLKNNKLFAPFEGFVNMYGIPNYYELDPTFFFGITYILMFGMMYGDIGHGTVLSLFGYYMHKAKKVFLGPILVCAGLCSIVFGVMYGSIFGFEHIYEGLWYKPMHNSDTMMSTLIYAIALGSVLISVAMLLNIVNHLRKKAYGEVFFSQSGLSGLLFFWSLIFVVLGGFANIKLVPEVILYALIGITLLAMFFKEPLIKLTEGEKHWFPRNFGEYFLETFFEMFEVCLSYVTNLISFVRVGAYALIHAGMLMVVMMFVEGSTGVTSVVILVLGNIFVIGMEGLLVAIQVLRLEFYELFSRFYTGDGKQFRPKNVR